MHFLYRLQKFILDNLKYRLSISLVKCILLLIQLLALVYISMKIKITINKENGLISLVKQLFSGCIFYSGHQREFIHEFMNE